eukprot:363537-Chlamydomonas_euryale.AAC.2
MFYSLINAPLPRLPQDAGMVMEVVEGHTDSHVRQQGNLVMSTGPSSPLSAAVSTACLQTAPTRSLVVKALRGGLLHSATSRCGRDCMRCQARARVTAGVGTGGEGQWGL